MTIILGGIDLKINFNDGKKKMKDENKTPISENKKKKKIESFNITRPWADIIKLEGVQSGHKLEAETKIKKIAFQSISSQKIYLNCIVEVYTKQYSQKKYDSKVNIKWDKTLNLIPELQKELEINSIVKIPGNKKRMVKLKTVKPLIKSTTANTLPNRIALKGEVAFSITYYATS